MRIVESLLVVISLDSIIQNELNLGSSIINLPRGEYKESIVIDRPCTIIGNGTTLWNENNPVLLVRSKGVTLKDLNLELTSISGYESDHAILQIQSDTIIDNVEVFGGIADTKKFYIPRSIHLGDFKSNVENTFKVSMYLPEDCIVMVKSSNVKISNSRLSSGHSDLILKVSPMEDGSRIYGELLLISKFIRRVFIDGIASQDALQHFDTLVYSANNIPQDVENEVFAVSVQSASSISKESKTKILQRGERCTLDRTNLTIRLTYNAINVDIDPYIFLTDENNHTIYNEDLVFFGNTTSRNGAISVEEDSSITMHLDRVPQYVKKVCVCYAIYNGKVKQLKRFSVVQNLKFSIYSNNFETFNIFPDALQHFSTMILLELYRNVGSWKINPIVSGYNGSLPQMCKSFGIDADY